MKVFKLSILFFISVFFIAACSKSEVADRIYNQQDQPYEIGRVAEGFLDDDELVGRESLDLQALGGLLERANNAEDFEYLLNSDDGINNLDLNDDGYADYISVREFGDRYDDERGFSLYSMFGSSLIQEIAQIIFDRERYDDGYYPGSRVLIRGNDYLYGDDYYYETNWLDRRVNFVDWVFSDRGDYYQSPYYYQNYPSYYEPYQIVETPVYLTRIEQYYYSPVFVQTAQPTVTEIRVESPYRDVSLSQAYMKVPEAERVQRQQQVLVERTNQRAKFEREKPLRTRDVSVREDKTFNEKPNRENPNRAERQEKLQNERPQQMRETREKPNRPERIERQPQNQQKIERQQQRQKVERPQQRQQQQVERPQRQPQQRVERPQQQQQRVERQQQRVERPQRQQQQQRQQVNQPQKPQKPENRVQSNAGGGNKGGGDKGGGKGKGKP